MSEDSPRDIGLMGDTPSSRTSTFEESARGASCRPFNGPLIATPAKSHSLTGLEIGQAERRLGYFRHQLQRRGHRPCDRTRASTAVGTAHDRDRRRAEGVEHHAGRASARPGDTHEKRRRPRCRQPDARAGRRVSFAAERGAGVVCMRSSQSARAYRFAAATPASGASTRPFGASSRHAAKVRWSNGTSVRLAPLQRPEDRLARHLLPPRAGFRVLHHEVLVVDADQMKASARAHRLPSPRPGRCGRAFNR